MKKTELKELADNSRGFPKAFVKATKKKGCMIFVHKHGNLDLVIQGGDVLNRPTIERWIKNDLIIVKGTKNLKEGHVFLGWIRSREFANAYIEKIEGDLAYISGMSIKALS